MTVLPGLPLLSLTVCFFLQSITWFRGNRNNNVILGREYVKHLWRRSSHLVRILFFKSWTSSLIYFTRHSWCKDWFASAKWIATKAVCFDCFHRVPVAIQVSFVNCLSVCGHASGQSTTEIAVVHCVITMARSSKFHCEFLWSKNNDPQCV